jgi:acetyl-CoA carboxylase carboxyl transferase subunit alpha
MDQSIIHSKIEEIKVLAEKEQIDISKELDDLKTKYAGSIGDTWDKVQLARRIDRPNTLDYIDYICDDFVELHGDRHYGDDPAMIGGIGTIDGMPVTFIGHQRGHNMKENIARNYGWAYPEGYRKALRLAKQAEKFRRPVVTFIDTAGAYPGVHAEERGIGEAIAVNLKSFSVLKVPIICFVIGEGGSGGALGIGVGDKNLYVGKLHLLGHQPGGIRIHSPQGCRTCQGSGGNHESHRQRRRRIRYHPRHRA